ncbi:MAG: CDP-alcohol phosphatidyltransferase family protein, partial [bacterium]|nr:CDP-alcohol phosphatidyltransferase family protein [bacterium]
MANIITLSRIFLAFIAMGLLFIGSKTSPDFAHISFIITIFVMWFDGLDGYIARKFNESSKLGAVLDIMGDRIVENIYWMVFCALGWISVLVPLIVLTRGIITDSLRSLALEKG